jgi:predicted ATPase
LTAALGNSRLLNPVRDLPDYFSHSELDPRLSILAQARDPRRTLALSELEVAYLGIHLHRDWMFGPNSPARQPTKFDQRTDVMESSGRNLATMAARLVGRSKRNCLAILRLLYVGVVDYQVVPGPGGSREIFFEEAGDVQIPATRLSDGTLRFLSLLLILLDPTPPPLIAIEEPELGLHPDIIPQVAKLLIEASERTQLVVTTHSRLLIDCLSEDPESIIVCEKHDGETVLQRLEADRLKVWLET